MRSSWSVTPLDSGPVNLVPFEPTAGRQLCENLQYESKNGVWFKQQCQTAWMKRTKQINDAEEQREQRLPLRRSLYFRVYCPSHLISFESKIIFLKSYTHEDAVPRIPWRYRRICFNGGCKDPWLPTTVAWAATRSSMSCSTRAWAGVEAAGNAKPTAHRRTVFRLSRCFSPVFW